MHAQTRWRADFALDQHFLSCGAILVANPGIVRIASGDWTWSPTPHDSAPSFFAPDFFLSTSLNWATPTRWVEMPISDFLGALEVLGSDLPVWTWLGPDREGFRKGFEDLQRSFAAGQLKKAVPVVFERASGRMSPVMLASMIRNLLERSGKARVYGLWNEQGGILGATPEDLFVSGSDGVLKTMALAGTYRKVPGFDSHSILSDPKERREHQLVIDDIRAALGELGELKVGETGVLELPTLVHLKTEIEVHMEVGRVPFERLVRALHPTAALGAFPREAGWQWLRGQESARDRKRFGAPFGLLWPKDGSVEAICVVAIRNIQWENDAIQLGSGCGLIAESVFEREWDELALKRDSVKRMMGLA